MVLAVLLDQTELVFVPFLKSVHDLMLVLELLYEQNIISIMQIAYKLIAFFDSHSF